MKDYELLIAGHVVDQLLALRSTERRMLRARFEEIRQSPGAFSDYTEQDSIGRALDINIFGKHTIVFWSDPADRQVKVLDLLNPDRPR